MQPHEIEALALRLPRHERARLARHLIDSLDDEDAVAAAWADEARRRSGAIASGRVDPVPADEAIAEARKRLATS